VQWCVGALYVFLKYEQIGIIGYCLLKIDGETFNMLIQTRMSYNLTHAQSNVMRAAKPTFILCMDEVSPAMTAFLRKQVEKFQIVLEESWNSQRYSLLCYHFVNVVLSAVGAQVVGSCWWCYNKTYCHDTDTEQWRK